MTNEMRIVDARETVISSIVKDIFSMGLLIGSFYINNKYLGNGIILQLLLGFTLFCFAIKQVLPRIKKVKTKEEAIEHIENFFSGGK
jgi:hypothetical protein